MKIATKLSMLFVSSLMLLAAFSPALALTSPIMAPELALISSGTAGSYNWSGYAVTGATFTSATGSYTVPTMTSGTSSTTTYYAAFWVGIDGFSSSTVEQTGILAETHGGTITYFAWYEFYPSALVELSTTSYPIAAGDTITATVTYTGTSGGSIATGALSPVASSPVISSTFTGSHSDPPRRSSSGFSVTISDSPKGWSYTATGTVSNAARSSAEWIVETPSVNGRLASLANFGTPSSMFSGCEATTSTGTTQPIASFSSVYSITMYNYPSATTVMAAPQTLSGGSFTVYWESAGP